MAAYYNEIDPFAAAWLRELITAGHIAPGDVDTRSIVDVRPNDLRSYTQCHFFAGIGVWSYALRRAGWPDNRPVWTGSCPCQPFSAAGKGGGFDDERHLWPAFYHLIGECGPPVVFGEQVASKDADPWIDLVQTDMEALGYAFGAVPFPSAGVGAPHIRDRTYWMADAGMRLAEQPAGLRAGSDETDSWWAPGRIARRGDVGGLDDDDDTRLEGRGRRYRGATGQRQGSVRPTAAAGELGGLADTDGRNASAERQQRSGEQRQQQEDGGVGRLADAQSDRCEHQPNVGPARVQREMLRPPAAEQRSSDLGATLGFTPVTGPTNGIWRDADWLFCRDGKWRPVEPGTFPLAHGAPARVGRLRGYGNAINAEAAVAFIEAATAHEIVDLDAERLRLTGAFA